MRFESTNLTSVNLGGGDRMEISDAAVLHNGNMYGNAQLHVTGGGMVYRLEAYDDSQVWVSSGGLVNSLVIGSDCEVHVQSGGVINHAFVSGGSLCIDESGSAHVTQYSFGCIRKHYNGIITFGGLMLIPKETKK